MNKNRIAALLLTGTLALPVLSAPPAPTPPERDVPPPEQHQGERPLRRPPPPHGGRFRPPEHDSDRRFRIGPGMWQVFAQLSPEERLAMQKLQREDPEKFREVMSAKADELYRKRKQRRDELHKLAEQCRNAATPEEKERLRKQLVAEVEKDFRAHLKANRRQLEDMKRLAARLEQELQRREAKIKEAVDARVEAMIKGEKPPRRPDSRGFDRKSLEK